MSSFFASRRKATRRSPLIKPANSPQNFRKARTTISIPQLALRASIGRRPRNAPPIQCRGGKGSCSLTRSRAGNGTRQRYWATAASITRRAAARLGRSSRASSTRSPAAEGGARRSQRSTRRSRTDGLGDTGGLKEGRKSMLFQAYHGVTAAQHQTNFNKWSAQGYRMISLSVYGDPGNALYAAVWVQRPGPGWVAIHGVDAAGYQSFFTKWSNQGYHAVLVSATGAINDAVFASVFEQGYPGPWFGRHGMTPADFAPANTSALNNRQMIRSFSIY